MTERSYELDQVVWVRTGDKHEEPGTVVEIGCSRSPAPDTSNRSNRGAKERMIELPSILVRLHVSAHKLVCDPSQLRPLEQDDPNNNSSSQLRRTPRRSTAATAMGRSVITPSPKTNPGESDADADVDKKPAAKRKQKEVQDASVSPNGNKGVLIDKDTEVSSLKRTKIAVAAAVASKPASKPPSRADDDDADTKIESTPKAPEQPSRAAVAAFQDESVGSRDSDNDDDDDAEERPFTVEYATSGRATCRRCDDCILKGNLRVSHVPLFRGKPGYRVYRHLECAVFTEDIHRAEDVGGWKKLHTEDYEALVLRVEESKLEIQKENEEIEPDELVQQAFQGETRESPPGLVAALLPFQVEGHSWMYHQEVHIPEIRGGILADEMGMVSTQSCTAVLRT